MTKLSYEQALEYIHSRYRFGSRPGLERSGRLLSALGDPQAGLRVIHVAGTNGKGSVAAMVASMLQAAGYRTGLYVSPYVTEFAERMRVDGRLIDPEEVADILAGEVRPAIERLARLGEPEDEVVEFEVVTAIAWVYFLRRQVDFLVAEVGLGGRFDATNVVNRPLLAIITSIGLDHTERLGPTVADIAVEKAGIIKRSAPVVASPQEPEAARVVAAAARRRGSPLFAAEPELWPAEPAGAAASAAGVAAPGAAAGPGPLAALGALPGGRVVLKSAGVGGQAIRYEGPGARSGGLDLHLPLIGPHQLVNAAAALTAVGLLKEMNLAPAVDGGSMKNGLAATIWPGRFEVFGEAPPIIVDGAHNPQGAKALAAALRQVFTGRNIHLVLGLLADKDVESFLSLVVPPAMPEVKRLFTSRPGSPRALPGEDLAAKVRSVAPGLPVASFENVGQALRAAVAAADPADVVCVAGSMYQLGDARKAAASLGRPRTGEGPAPGGDGAALGYAGLAPGGAHPRAGA